jgi:glutamine synthetase
VRKIRRGRELALQTAGQGRRLERLGHALELLDHLHARKGGKKYFEALMAAFDKYKNEHIAVYGPDNHLRLTGLHETQSIDKFNYGVANRGASVRVPAQLREQRLQGLPRGSSSEFAG